MDIDWAMPAKLFIASARGGQSSPEPDYAADLKACVTMAQGWPPGGNYTLHTAQPVTGKTVLTRADVDRLPAPA